MNSEIRCEMSDITFITDKLIQTSKLIELNIVRQNIEMQIAEAELLQAMYPSEQEFKLNDMTILENLRQWLDLDNQMSDLPENSLSFVLTLDDFELHVQFPNEYPADRCAEIFVRSDKLMRDNQSRLNKDMLIFLNEVFETDCAITSEAISWLQEHFKDYIVETVQEPCSNLENIESGPVKLGRLWLYSHMMHRDC